MTLVIKSDAGVDKSSPHLALCHEAQGFSANNRHVSLLMKSEDGVEYTSEIIKAMQSVGLKVEEDIIKAVWYREKHMALSNAVKENFGGEKEWVYVEDFTDTEVVFCKEDGMYSVEYSTNASGSVKIAPLAKPVMTVTSYVYMDGKMELSEEAEDALEEGMLSLVKSILDNEQTQVRLKDILIKVTKKEGDENLPASAYAYVPDVEMPSTWKLRIDDANHVRAAVAALGEGFRGNKVEIPADDLPAVKRKVRAAYRKFFPDAEELPAILKSKEEVSTLEEAIQKAVAEAEKVLKAQVADLTDQLEKAKTKVAEYEQVQKEAVTKSRKEALAKVVAEDEVEAVYKSLEALDQEAFGVVVKTFEKKSKVEQESDLFKEKGVSGEGEPVKQEEVGLKLVGDLINKSKKAKQ